MSSKRARWARGGLLLAWEAPQSLLGAARLGLALARGRVRETLLTDERIMVELSEGAAVSLGLFVLWTNQDNAFVPVGEENRDHELGHARQSRLLGPLYLPVVGVTSTVRVAYAVGYRVVRGRRWGSYYDGFPERWADELGDVDRTLRPGP